MKDTGIVARFDTEETATKVAQAMNEWFFWIMEGDIEEYLDAFDDLGVSAEDYALERGTDVTWEDIPVAYREGNCVIISMEDEAGTTGVIEDLLEALGAYDTTYSSE